jgi:Fe-S-cluster containining protein
MNETCKQCGGACCRSLFVPITGREPEELEWLARRGLLIGESVFVRGECRYLKAGRCECYAVRPAVCRVFEVDGVLCRMTRKLLARMSAGKEGI